MSSDLKPIKLWSHPSGPNPWKVALFLEELNLPHEHHWIAFENIKKEPYTSINPNARVPSIEDPNTGIVLSESGAILEYLADVYDKEGNLHYLDGPEKYQQLQWLHFQMSGQGPYFGQRVWFLRYHPEKIASVQERYANEIKRVIGVIDGHLAKQKTDWLVGDKFTYADLAFLPWNMTLPLIIEDVDVAKEFPLMNAWHQRIVARPAVAKTLKKQEEAKATVGN